MRSVDCEFEITSWDEEAYDEPAEGPKLTRVRIAKRYRGAIEGSSTTEVLTAQGAGGSAYVGSERIVGSLEGREGSFVIQHGGVMDGSDSSVFGQIVPGSGTGALEGLRGGATEGRHEVLSLELEA